MEVCIGQRYNFYEEYAFVPDRLEMIEGVGGQKRPVVSGIFQRVDVENMNQRIYTRGLWENILQDSEVRDRLDNNAMFGELDHPKDGRTLLSRASHIITELNRPDERGNVYGSAIILDTQKGRDLYAILKAGGRVGASTRGHGVLSKDGKTIDEDTYALTTVDFVADPSSQGAYLSSFTEGVDVLRLDDILGKDEGGKGRHRKVEMGDRKGSLKSNGGEGEKKTRK